MKRCYEPKEFNAMAMRAIEHANKVVADYAKDGFSITLRQLYYYFVGHALFERRYAWDAGRKKWVPDENGTTNADPNYTWLGGVISDARLAGLVDWGAITDRTRTPRALLHRAHPRDIVAEGVEDFRFWLWEDQPHYVEVWVEKDALVDVVASVANRNDIAFFSCRGFASITSLHEAAKRLENEANAGKKVHVLYLGDHDPSGVDMTRNIAERLKATFKVDMALHRIALNMNQIERYNPPSDPAKLTDSRTKGYVEKYGEECWELDALDVRVMAELIEKNIHHWRDDALWMKACARQDKARHLLKGIHDRWNEVVRMVKLPPIDVLQKPITQTDYDAQ